MDVNNMHWDKVNISENLDKAAVLPAIPLFISLETAT